MLGLGTDECNRLPMHAYAAVDVELDAGTLGLPI